jgi:hypothetical protein
MGRLGWAEEGCGWRGFWAEDGMGWAEEGCGWRRLVGGEPLLVARVARGVPWLAGKARWVEGGVGGPW